MKAVAVTAARPGWGLWLGVCAFVLVMGTVGYLYKGRVDTLNGPPLTEAEGRDGVSQEQLNAMVQGLSERLQKQPDDAKGWAMLGRSYMVMGQHAQAKKALQELVRLRPDDPSALADLADAAGMVQGRSLDGEPIGYIRRALKIDPKHVKALALAGTEAFARQDYLQAARYWETITTVEPPDSPVHQQALAGVEEARRLASAGSSRPAMAAPQGSAQTSAETSAQTSAQNAAPTRAGPPAAGAASVSGTVTLSAALRAKVAPEDTVFVFARPADGSRVPLAILRKQVKDLPLKFTLDDSMGMGQGPNQGLAAAKQVIVGARISKSGQAMPQPGDLEGFSAAVPVGKTGVQVEISSVK